MRYLERSFTLPAGSSKITQTDWEIAMGIRNPDGSLKQPRKKTKTVRREN